LIRSDRHNFNPRIATTILVRIADLMSTYTCLN